MQNQHDWTQVKDFEGLYEINMNGQIRSCHKRNFQKVIASRIDRGGYVATSLTKNGKHNTFLIHRLIGENFIANPNNKKCINHKNGIKTDNRIENLEWVTHSENMKHAYETGLIKKKSRPIIDKCLGKIYSCINEAATVMGIKNSTLKGYLSGQRTNPTCLGYMHSVAA
jgi:hypothetical protein